MMDKFNEGVTYVFGENADLNGRVYGDWVLDFVYYKDTPMWNDLFEKLRNTFWNILKPIIAMLNQ